jgi:flagellar assembly protein FliH
MTSVTKFSFENSFDAVDLAERRVAEEAAPPPPPTYSEAELAAARCNGFAEGHEAGTAEALRSLENTVAQALGAISDQLGSIAPLYRGMLESSRAEAIGIAGAIARKFVAGQAVDGVLSAVESVIAAILPRVMDEPRIVIRVSDALLDPLRERIPAITGRSGFPGSLILLAEPALSGPDCRIEWADGGAEHDSGSLWSEIDGLIERYVAGIGIDDDSPASGAGDATAVPNRGLNPEEHSNG